MAVDQKQLVRTLTPTGYKALEAAVVRAANGRHETVTVDHVLAELLDRENGDTALILRHFGMSREALATRVQQKLARRGTNAGRPAFGEELFLWFADALAFASLATGVPRVRTGALFAQLVFSPFASYGRDYHEIEAIDDNKLKNEYAEIVAPSAESVEVGSAASPSATGGADAAPSGATAEGENLKRFTTDYTALARAGKIDPVFGRHREIRQMVDILARRRKNNPIIVGESGVGKTALVEGLALEIVNGNIPDKFLSGKLDPQPAPKAAPDSKDGATAGATAGAKPEAAAGAKPEATAGDKPEAKEGDKPAPVAAPASRVRLLGLDLGALQAGASVKGEFENRLKNVIKEVKESPVPIVLFIDEAHTIIGAGGSAGGSDAANLLKPALARGELRTIAATTWTEYKKYFEKDAALERRFQPVKVDEPSESECILMIRGLRPLYEATHGVAIRDDAVVAAVRLSLRYVSGRQLPDKAVDLLDTAATRVKINLDTRPGELEELEVARQAADRERDALTRDQVAGFRIDAEKLAKVKDHIVRLDDQIKRLTLRWEGEKDAVREVNAARKAMGAAKAGDDERAARAALSATTEKLERVRVSAEPEDLMKFKAELAAIERGEGGDRHAGRVQERVAELTAKIEGLDRRWVAERDSFEALSRARRAQAEAGDDNKPAQAAVAEAARLFERNAVSGRRPLVHSEVEPDVVAQVIADWTGIPVGKMQSDTAAAVLTLESRLRERVIGQEDALKAVAETLRTSQAGVNNPTQPVGVLLFVGSSGVGKTETALALADVLFGGERFMTTINMSEFQEKHTVSRLIGSPPGYVGFGEGGMLTEAVRQRPYSVVLLDECEKADLDVMNLFYQVFDKGSLSDGEGRHINFRNTIIILTSNLATDEIMKLYQRDVPPTAEEVAVAIRPVLSKHFKPALLARMNIVPFAPISRDSMRKITELRLSGLKKRLWENQRVEAVISPELVAEIARRCTEAETGARNVEHILRGSLIPLISRKILEGMAEGPLPPRLDVGLDPEGGFRVEFHEAN